MSRARYGVTEDVITGWRALRLATDTISVTVLPDKGADIYELIDLATGIDPLYKTPWGLQPPGAAPRPGSDAEPFLANYEGTWQELFPNTDSACIYRGSRLPFHGEAATRPWLASVEADDKSEVAVRFTFDATAVPLRLERLVCLRQGERRLHIAERVTNLSAASVDFVWGHHCVLGPPLIAAGAEFRVPAAVITTPSRPWEDTCRLEPGQRSSWPMARLREGGVTDLSHVPGPEEGSHDDVFLTGLDGGWAEVGNEALGLGFQLRWDPSVFRWIVSWQPYGGAMQEPLRGTYALGVEPWTAGGNLERALADGEALCLAGHEQLATQLSAGFIAWPPGT